MFRSVLLASLALTLAAQSPAPAPTAPAAPAAPAPQAPAAPAAPAEPAPAPVDKVLATVAGEEVKDSDFNLFLDISMPENQRQQVMVMPGAKDQYLKRFLEYKVLAAKAKKEGVGQGPAYAKRMQMMEMQILIQSLFERDGATLKEKSAVNDDDVKAYFDKHPDKFITPEAFSARHILVMTKAQGPEKGRTDEEAMARIHKIQKGLKEGKTFEAMAKEYSDDPGSKDKGGLYENMPFGRFVPEFEKAVRDQPVGKVGKPVKSSFGYHLIKVEKITPAVPQTFEAAKDTAKQQASAERQEKVMDDYMNAAKAEAGYAEAKAPAAPAVQEGAK